MRRKHAGWGRGIIHTCSQAPGEVGTHERKKHLTVILSLIYKDRHGSPCDLCLRAQGKANVKEAEFHFLVGEGNGGGEARGGGGGR